MRPETAFAVKTIIEEHFNYICASFNLRADQEAYFNQLLDHIRAILPTRDSEFYFNICLDFWENIIEPAKSLDQSERWGERPHDAMAVMAKTPSSQEGEAPGAAEISSQYQPSKAEVTNLVETQVVLDQITSLGDCLIAIAEDKDLQPRKQTFVSLGVLIHQIVAIIKDLADKKDI